MNDVILRIIARDESRAALEDARQSIERLNEETRDGIKQNKGLNLSFTELYHAIGLASGAFALLKQGWDLAKEGAEIEYTRDRFDRLAESIGTTGDALLRDLKIATRSTMSDFELMKSAGDLASLGLARTSDEAVRLARVASVLNMPMNQLVLTLTNMTTMRFDSLGVSVDGFKEKVKELERQGYETEKAFREAFLRQAEEQIGKVGDATTATVGKFKKFEASWENFVDRVKAGLADAVTPLLDDTNLYGTLLDTNVDASYKLAEAQAYLAEHAYGKFSDSLRLQVIPALEREIAMKQSATTVNRTLADSLRETLDASLKLFETQRGYAERLQLENDYAAAVERTTHQLEVQAAQAAAIVATKKRIDELTSAVNTSRIALYNMAETLGKDGVKETDYARLALSALEAQLKSGQINATAYGLAYRSLGVDVGLVSNASLAASDAITRINGLYASGRIDAQTYSQAIQAIPAASADGVIRLEELGIKLGDTLKRSKQDVLDEMGNASAEAVNTLSGRINTAMQAISTSMSTARSLAETEVGRINQALQSIPTEVRTTYIIDTQGYGTGGHGRAAGGPVYAGQAYTVGERGPETLVMGYGAGYVIPHTTNNYAATFNINGANDPAGIAAYIDRHLGRQSDYHTRMR